MSDSDSDGAELQGVERQTDEACERIQREQELSDAADEQSEDADGEESDEDAAGEAGTGARKAQRKAGAAADVKRRKSKPRAGKNPVRAAQRRGQRILKEVQRLLSLRADVKLNVINRLIIGLQAGERAELRSLGAMQQERYVAVKEAVEVMERSCFTALNSVDLRSCLALPVSTLMTIRERLSRDASGQRVVLARPPPYTGIGNPVTRKSNRAQGINYEHKCICVPYVFREPGQIKAALDKVLDGYTLNLAFDFDAAAWDLRDMARSLLLQLEADENLLKLPAGALRVLQLIFDGHGWSSRCGAVRFTLRCVHTIEGHNDTRNARDPMFALGTDKCADIARMIKVQLLLQLYTLCARNVYALVHRGVLTLPRI